MLKFVEYFNLRDIDIKESFEKIQTFIDEHGLDRKILKCTKVITPKVKSKNGLTGVSYVDLEISSNKGTIEYRIDDAFFSDKQWLFTDSPMTFKLGELSISFIKNTKLKTEK